MASVLLVFGNPGAGKSTLARKLKSDHRFEVISVDDAYVEWVKAQCQPLYFDALGHFIAQHYHCILSGEYSKGVFSRDMVAEWHSYLLTGINELSQRHDRLVVEGYLLFDCKDSYETELTRRSTQVFQIQAEQHSYFSVRGRLTVEQIASLGM